MYKNKAYDNEILAFTGSMYIAMQDKKIWDSATQITLEHFLSYIHALCRLDFKCIPHDYRQTIKQMIVYICRISNMLNVQIANNKENSVFQEHKTSPTFDTSKDTNIFLAYTSLPDVETKLKEDIDGFFNAAIVLGSIIKAIPPTILQDVKEYIIETIQVINEKTSELFPDIEVTSTTE